MEPFQIQEIFCIFVNIHTKKLPKPKFSVINWLPITGSVRNIYGSVALLGTYNFLFGLLPLYITLSYQAAVNAGLPHTVPAMGINMVCGSGLRAVALSAQVFFFPSVFPLEMNFYIPVDRESIKLC